MLSETWEDQYKRMHRSYERLKKAADEYIARDPELHNLETSRDILYHFCADAYHLKDYIKNTPNQTQAIETSVEHLCDATKANASTALAICADVANGFKHLDLKTSKFPPGGEAEVKKQEAGVTLPFRLGAAHFTYHFTIEADGNTYSEIKVAEDAIGDWDTWLTGQGFALPSL
jgi:antitoxin component HigA of HigAB toxin-antitoxin module